MMVVVVVMMVVMMIMITFHAAIGKGDVLDLRLRFLICKSYH